MDLRRLLRDDGDRRSEKPTRNAANEGSLIHWLIISSMNGSPYYASKWS